MCTTFEYHAQGVDFFFNQSKIKLRLEVIGFKKLCNYQDFFSIRDLEIIISFLYSLEQKK